MEQCLNSKRTIQGTSDDKGLNLVTNKCTSKVVQIHLHLGQVSIVPPNGCRGHPKEPCGIFAGHTGTSKIGLFAAGVYSYYVLASLSTGLEVDSTLN